jgi:lipid-binding SYLF domain-containing protein
MVPPGYLPIDWLHGGRAGQPVLRRRAKSGRPVQVHLWGGHGALGAALAGLGR